jgi:hypothetical protein
MQKALYEVEVINESTGESMSFEFSAELEDHTDPKDTLSMDLYRQLANDLSYVFTFIEMEDD